MEDLFMLFKFGSAEKDVLEDEKIFRYVWLFFLDDGMLPFFSDVKNKRVIKQQLEGAVASEFITLN